MEQIARKFFEDESLLRLELGPDGVVGFLASNYVEVLGIYRAMVKQNEATCKKKEKAHQQVKIAQRVIAKAKNKTIPKEVAEKIKYWKEQMEEDDVIYYKGKPLYKSSALEFVLKYSIIVEALDSPQANRTGYPDKGSKLFGEGRYLATQESYHVYHHMHGNKTKFRKRSFGWFLSLV